jgi:hypothetical protein
MANITRAFYILSDIILRTPHPIDQVVLVFAGSALMIIYINQRRHDA